MATSGQTRPVAAVVIVVALVAALGGWWWTNRDTTPQVGDRGRVTARVEAVQVRLSLEFKGVDFAAQGKMSADGGLEWPAAWRGQEIEGTLEITERNGNRIRGSFTSDGIEVPVHTFADGTFQSGPTLIWG